MSDESAKSAIKEAMNKIDSSKIKSESEQVKDITGKHNVPIIASHSGNEYHFCPVSINQIPELSNIIKDIQDFMIKNESQSNDVVLLTLEDNFLLKKISKLISMGIKEGMEAEKAGDEFSIGDFPKCLSLTLDLNDFLLGMGNVYQMTNQKKS